MSGLFGHVLGVVETEKQGITTKPRGIAGRCRKGRDAGVEGGKEEDEECRSKGTRIVA